MLKRVEVENFRGIRRCCIDELSLINIFIGPNNTCKSTLLDAIYLGLKEINAPSISQVLQTRAGRGVDRPELFFNYDESLKIRISLYYNIDGVEKWYMLKIYKLASTTSFYTLGGVRLSISPDRCVITFEHSGEPGREYFYYQIGPHFETGGPSESPSLKLGSQIVNYAQNAYLLLSCVTVSDLWKALDKNLTKIKLRRDIEEDFVRRIKDIYSEDSVYRLSHYEYVPKPIDTNVRLPALEEEICREGTRRVALRTYGTFHGMGPQRGALMLSYLELQHNTALLIEEPETFQHPRAMRKLVKHIIELAKKNNVQLFITTHSYGDFLSFVKYAPNIEPNDLRCYLLRREPDEIRAERVENRIDQIIQSLYPRAYE